MPSDVSAQTRRQVSERAGHRCEYCLLSQAVVLHQHEPDHIVPRQHGGATHENNLALSCMRCNRYKGPNIGSFDPMSGELVPFFNPRVHRWTDHFQLNGSEIQALTAEGRVTEKILRFNDADRVVERQRLIDLGSYGRV